MRAADRARRMGPSAATKRDRRGLWRARAVVLLLSVGAGGGGSVLRKVGGPEQQLVLLLALGRHVVAHLDVACSGQGVAGQDHHHVAVAVGDGDRRGAARPGRWRRRCLQAARLPSTPCCCAPSGGAAGRSASACHRLPRRTGSRPRSRWSR